MAFTHSHAYRLARIATVAGMAFATVPAFAQATPAPGNVQASPQAHGTTISLADLAERVMPAVVNIAAVTTSETRGRNLPQLPQLGPDTPFGDLFEEFFNRRGRGGEQGQNQNQPPQQRRSQSAGSGFVVDPSGLVVTNNHVIGDANEITVVFSDGLRLKAEVIGKDTKVDLALLRVKHDKPLPFVKFGDSDKMRIGDPVMAIGNPFGLGGSVSSGIVSARNRDINQGPYDTYIQTDAAINKGNSGGPLFNMAGEVIGINTAILSPTGGSVGIGFAVPSSLATNIVDQLREFGETRRGWLGVRIQNVDDAAAEALGLGTARGALIAGIDEKGPAKPAGLEVGDVIVKFDGKDVKDSRELPRIVASTAVGKDVPIQVMRKGKELNKTVKLARLEDGEKVQQASANKPAGEAAKPVTASALGLEFSAQNDDLRKRYSIKDGLKGVVITKVDANSNAADKRILVGELVVEVGQEPVNSPEDVTKRLDALKKEGKKSALLLVSNAQGEVRFVAVTMS
ncbi:putative periplasmic serine endoprotease DegP-like [Bosea sp. 62]|uniref:DegQ family serine endoprotease n=1 Tax=unclassified Bosea (in: a-proteobacteria) TaxID=2653178 RepID=UPI0012533502|nr:MULTISPECIES: DegQ family serine endoprotease [unclassified Bosea (in: a-proteobacteria)]CAD5246665.1 putative periplasmic serine endoprotease DegP-like [Bosea sp. 21B]CAD5247201.1 putative periplasmic serine endoprotease DegP-like [Bosea sp. 7B]CAD5269218.1 putative periplasmic serine endoprotease DegP-like [Bosea sp. 46]VVT50660.1 putative periplasmic serine endoprotease DegP-like [Bosea sp. EC-HK365B]VXA98112.1 putative periplasmic serine endoprotease DegP-like [Bosea sp. 127]